MKLLTETEFRATFAEPMQRLGVDAESPVEFWSYFDAIPSEDFAGHDCSEGSVTYVWTDATGHFQHVLINSENRNVFMVVVLDARNALVLGHRLLDLNHGYGLQSA